MDNQSSKIERYNDLKADQAVFGLSPEEAKELASLQAELGLAESLELEQTAAQVYRLFDLAEPEPLPGNLQDSILNHAAEFDFSSKAGHQSAAAEIADEAKATPRSIDSSRPTTANASAVMPWLVAAVCLSIALFAVVFNWDASEATPQQLRAQLLASAKDVVQVDWSPGTTPIEGVTGNVVWSESQQRGYMSFDGLPPNDATKEQYQLWIFGKNRPEETPVDGGVFDIASTGKTIVPINAKLAVDATVFAITIEPPGGVVVSKREKLPLIAAIN